MNEGHSALLTLELYRQFGFKYGWDDCFVKTHCVFTTHTPIAAGHDQFPYEDLYDRLRGEKNIIPLHIKKLAGEDKLNMTRLALSFSDYSNAVSRKHGEVTKQMFPDKTIDYITNGIHAATWTHPKLAELFTLYMPKWKEDNAELINVGKIPNSELYRAHATVKKELIEFVNTNSITGSKLDEQILTIGFARRFVAYKDAELIFSNIDNLKRLGKKVQFIFAGKAHKKDMLGKEILRRIIEKAKELKEYVSIAFIENYNIEIAKKLVSGCDMWLNTPIPFNEASGTSGMKASVNGCLHFSRLDGWAIEAYELNCGGYPISDYKDFITTLEFKVIPGYYAKDKSGWLTEMKLAIGNAGSYFSTHRMAKEYVKKAYKM
jgi:starch phosphorylase